MRAQLPSDAADLPPGAMLRDPSDRWSAAVTPPRGVYKLKDDATGYVMTKPFEANNPMPGAFRETCDYIVPMLKPVLKPKGQGVKKAPTEAGAEASTSGKAKKEKKPAAVVEDVDPILKSKLAVGVVVDVGLVNAIEGFSTFACKPLVNIHDVTVMSSHRGRGIAGDMLSRVADLARERGACKMTTRG